MFWHDLLTNCFGLNKLVYTLYIIKWRSAQWQPHWVVVVSSWAVQNDGVKRVVDITEISPAWDITRQPLCTSWTHPQSCLVGLLPLLPQSETALAPALAKYKHSTTHQIRLCVLNDIPVLHYPLGYKNFKNNGIEHILMHSVYSYLGYEEFITCFNKTDVTLAKCTSVGRINKFPNDTMT